MSKHALEAYSDALAAPLLPLGVHVCAVAPGSFDSAIDRNVAARFEAPANASEDLAAWYGRAGATSRSMCPSPERVDALGLAERATRRRGRGHGGRRRTSPCERWR